MGKNDAIRILRNLDKIKHLAAGGEFSYLVVGKIYYKMQMNLPYLDTYTIVKIPVKVKPHFKLLLNNKLRPLSMRIVQ